MSRTHLFVALATAPWGELLYAIRAATQLVEAGDQVCFLAPPAVATMLRDTPIRHLPLVGADWLDQLDAAVATERCACIVLVDIAITYTYLEAAQLDGGFVARFSVPVIGLDVWNLHATNLLMERGSAGWMLSAHSRDVVYRLLPSPMVRPTGWADPVAAGVFSSLDRSVPTDRARARAELGLPESARLVLLPTAAWQQPDVPPTDPYVARLTRAVPSVIAGHLAQLPDDVRVLHVGVRDFPELQAALGPRYRRSGQLARADFLGVLAASDLVLSLNAMATTLGAAAQVGVPILLGTNASGGRTVEDVVATTAFPLVPRVREQLAALVPLYPFRVWPFGLFHFTAPVVADNPCVTMATPFEVLDEAGFVAAATALLRDADAIAAARARMQAMLAAVAQLPSAVDIFDHHLGGR